MKAREGQRPIMYRMLSSPQVLLLSQHGGGDVGADTRTYLRMLMTDDLQMEFSWEGQKGKKKLKNFKYLLMALQGKH